MWKSKRSTTSSKSSFQTYTTFCQYTKHIRVHITSVQYVCGEIASSTKAAYIAILEIHSFIVQLNSICIFIKRRLFYLNILLGFIGYIYSSFWKSRYRFPIEIILLFVFIRHFSRTHTHTHNLKIVVRDPFIVWI